MQLKLGLIFWNKTTKYSQQDSRNILTLQNARVSRCNSCPSIIEKVNSTRHWHTPDHTLITDLNSTNIGNQMITNLVWQYQASPWLSHVLVRLVVLYPGPCLFAVGFAQEFALYALRRTLQHPSALNTVMTHKLLGVPKLYSDILFNWVGENFCVK